MIDLVAAFRGERYAAADRLSRLIAPPYDVISPDERTRYAARDPRNIVHLMLPEAPPGEDRYALAADRLAAWRGAGVLCGDAAAGVYVMAQDFVLPGGERRTRTGVFAAVAAEAYERRRIRPHERTHAAPKADRLALLRATATNLESIFLLAPDSDGGLAAALAQVVRGSPDATAELDGVGIRLWVVTGDSATRIALLASRVPLYIADGHHRFETAVAYARQRAEAERVLGFIVSARDPGLIVLPTHRVIYGAGREVGKLLEGWRSWFEVGRLAPDADRLARLAEAGAERPACVVSWPGEYDLVLTLRPDAPLDAVQGLEARVAGRLLDVAVVEALVVKEILGMSTTTPTLKYTADAAEAVNAVRHGSAAAAVLLNPTPVEQVLAVADAGGVLPPKSTYFAPKVPSGLVLRPLA